MGGEGSMASAINTLRQNRAMLKRRKLRSKDEVYGAKGVTKLNLKQSTPEDIMRVRKKMKALRKENRAEWFISVVVFIILLSAFFWLFFPDIIV